MSPLRNNRGVTLVFVAMGLLIFLLFLGLALDTGWLVYVRAQGQARVDSAALAASAALIEDSSDRKTRAEELANTFSDKNSVVNGSVDPANNVDPMNYDQISGELQGASSWDLWGGSAPCNAVRVITDVPTPVFFAGIRNVFGAGETGQENVTVSAVSYLPCPAETQEGLAQMAIVKAFWNFPANCEIPRSSASLNVSPPVLAKATFVSPLQAGTALPSVTSTLPTQSEIQSSLPQCDDSAIVPVVDSMGTKIIVGFASLCWTNGTGGTVNITLKCGKVAPSSAGAGECFGTYASNPILIR